MDIKGLLGLRPKAETIEEVEAALARARDASRRASARVAELLTQRAATLLGGSEAEIAGSERELAEARAAAERAETIVPALDAKLQEMRRKQKLDALAALIVQANKQRDLVDAAIRQRYVELAAAMVRDVLLPEKRAAEALSAARQAYEAACNDPSLKAWEGLRERGVELKGLPFAEIAKPGGGFMTRPMLGGEVALPGFDGVGGGMDSGRPFWPMRDDKAHAEFVAREQETNDLVWAGTIKTMRRDNPQVAREIFGERG